MAKSLLDDVMVAAPCDVSWDSMQGDDRVRRCSGCSKNVYNISDMSDKEAQELLRTNTSPCLRLFRRADGTLITDNCPRGLRKLRDRFRKIATAAAGILATVLTVGPVHAQNKPSWMTGSVLSVSEHQPHPVRITAGKLAPRFHTNGQDPSTGSVPHVQIWNAPATGTATQGRSADGVQSFEVGPDTSALDLYTRAVNFERNGSTLLAKTLYSEALEAAEKNKNSDPAFEQLLQDSVKRLDQELRGY
ncbi:MAG TPA: hypothetical protein V6D22_00645 [Candidatus Obscuribacterales bacterium]